MIDDPYNEFFVEEFGEGCQLEQVQRKYELVYDTYWEKRYSLNIQQVGFRNFFVVYRSYFCSALQIRLLSENI